MRALIRLAHLLAVATLAITVPVFIATGPQYYVGRGADGVDVVLVAVVVAFAPALALFALGTLAGRADQRAGEIVHLVSLGLLAAALASAFLIPFGLPPLVRGIAALASGAAGAWWYTRSSGLRQVLTVLAPAVVVVLAVYLLQPRMGQLTVGWGGEPPARAAAVERPSPVVMIVLDEMSGLSVMDRHGRLDRRRLPNFGRLADDATWYPNATSARSDTEIAVPSILTGRWVPLDSMPIESQHPRNLYAMLADSHRVRAFEPWSDICPERLCPRSSRRSLGERVGGLLATMPLIAGQVVIPAAERLGVPRPRESTAPPRPEQIRRFVAGLRPTARPGLHVLHVLLPHKPWRYLPSGQRYADTIGRDRWLAGFHQWGDDPWVVAQNEQRYLLQVGYVDRMLGRVLDRLKQTGLYDDATVVVMADHGVSFRAGDRRRDATQTNGQDILSIPLLMKLPRQRQGRVDRRLVRSIDVAPTLAAVQGARPTWRFEGRSLLGPVRRRGVWIENRAGGRLEWDAATFARRRDRALRERVARFGDGLSPRRLWELGTRRDLLGRSVARAGRGDATGRADVDDPAALATHRPGAERVAARIAGTVDGIRPGTSLALALNGRIAATTRAYDGDRGVEFSAIVEPRRALRAGENRLELFAVSGRGPATRLRPIALAG